jgi:hypothetical protein
MAELGLPIEFTEVTIPTFGDSLEDEEIQAQLLKNLYSVWFSHPAVNTIVYWNQFDGHCYDAGPGATWNENNCRGGLFHKDLTPKKSAEVYKKLIKRGVKAKVKLYKNARHEILSEPHIKETVVSDIIEFIEK